MLGDEVLLLVGEVALVVVPCQVGIIVDDRERPLAVVIVNLSEGRHSGHVFFVARLGNVVTDHTAVVVIVEKVLPPVARKRH